MLPLSGTSPWTSAAFWIGLAFCTFPLNLLVYGWNDIADFELDQFNPRKGNLLFGAVSTKEQIEKLPFYIIAVMLSALAVVLLSAPMIILLWLVLMIVINWLYNRRKNGLRTMPPFELVAQIGYLMVVPFSMEMNGIDGIHPAMWLYLFLFAMQSHLMGEVMDIDADRRGGRKTTATQIGARKTKMLIMTLVLLEIILMFLVFDEVFFGSFLVAVLLWLIIDAFILFKSKRYSFIQMKLFSISSNIIAVATMIYVYFYGSKFL